MAVDAIGSVLQTQDAGLPANSKINEQDFIKLFVSELQYQDPMQPMDNGQFLTQLAQFVGIQQQQQTVQGVDNLLALSASGQSLGLLNHTIQFAGVDGTTVSTGRVTAIAFDANGASLSVATSSSNTVTGVRMSQVQQITP
jgi:flagellar basal-body rod modification protein FlgD